MVIASSSDITIRRVSEPHGWMGNMSPYPLMYDGERYPTAEHLFQALRFASNEVRALIRAERSPMGAKMRAKALAAQHELIVVPRTPNDVANMEHVIKLKLEQHPHLHDYLMYTGSQKIVEDCSRRPNESGLFWGAKLADGQWIGQNWLGTLWMIERGDKRPVWS